jgi:hypothetical protein
MYEPREELPRLPLSRRGKREKSAALATPMRAGRVGQLEAPALASGTPRMAATEIYRSYRSTSGAAQARPFGQDSSPSGSLGSSTTLPSVPTTVAVPVTPMSRIRTTPEVDPDVWLIALPQPNGGFRSLEGAGRVGAIRVSRPYGHLRSIRPVVPPSFGSAEGGELTTGGRRRAKSSGTLDSGQLQHPQVSGSLGSATTASYLPAQRPLPQVVGAVEVETDSGLFRVERKDGVLGHSDMGWALAHLDPGEPDSQVAISRRQLALLLTLLPTPQDPDSPEQDPQWGWAHKLRGPWERGPLHTRGRLGRLIAFDPDESGKGMHRACFELLGSEEIVWAMGVPCFRSGSVYELVPIGKGLHPSRWLTWPLTKGRRRAGETPSWEIARIVYRVGAPRWPLAGVIEPLGPLGVAG